MLTEAEGREVSRRWSHSQLILVFALTLLPAEFYKGSTEAEEEQKVWRTVPLLAATEGCYHEKDLF